MDDEKDEFDSVFSHEPEQTDEEAPASEIKEPEKTEETPPEKPEAETKTETETQPAPEVDEEPQTPEPSAKEPISQEQFKGYTDEREKRQKVETERDVLQAQLNAFNATQEQARETSKRPDIFDDPEGARVWDDARHAGDLLDAKLSMSQLMATQEFGAEKVKEAQEAWPLLPPHEQLRIQASQHPYRELISERENKGVLDEIAAAGGLDKLIDKKLAERNGEVTQIGETITKAAVKPPPSLAKGGHVQKGAVQPTEEEDFAAVFEK